MKSIGMCFCISFANEQVYEDGHYKMSLNATKRPFVKVTPGSSFI